MLTINTDYAALIFLNKMVIIRTENNKTLVRIANRDYPDQTASSNCSVCLGLVGSQRMFKNFRTFTVVYIEQNRHIARKWSPITSEYIFSVS